ncbi:hypothetical protein ACFL2I_07770 [Candidatus Omnitrophota bacterium]
MKALALLSGGLDSTLAIKVILDQGIEVEAVNFFTPFCRCNSKSGCAGGQAKKVAERFGVKFKMFYVGVEYFQILKNPKHGFGKNINPCIDCRIMMHKKAKTYMREIGAAFIINGEVLGQRPMSQHRAAMTITERESELSGLILRPLSAKLLPITIPEQEGWVDRERLLEISGRSRKPQMAMAEEHEIGDYPCAAGGCLLTDPGFSRRMKDLLGHEELSLNAIELLKVGRHFRLNSGCKLVVGRDQQENEKLLQLIRPDDLCFMPEQINGPVAVGRGIFEDNAVTKAAQIVARYSDSLKADQVKVKVEHVALKKVDLITVDNNIKESQLDNLRI